MEKAGSRSAVQSAGRKIDGFVIVPKTGVRIQRHVYLEDEKTLASGGFASGKQEPQTSRDFSLLHGTCGAHAFDLGELSSPQGAFLVFQPEGSSFEQNCYFLKRTWRGIDGPPRESDQALYESLMQKLSETQGFLLDYAESILEFGSSGGVLAAQPCPTNLRGKIVTRTLLQGGDVARAVGYEQGASPLGIEIVDTVISYAYMRFLVGDGRWRALPPNQDKKTYKNVSSFADYRAHAEQNPHFVGELCAHPDFAPWMSFCKQWHHDPFTPPRDPRILSFS